MRILYKIPLILFVLFAGMLILSFLCMTMRERKTPHETSPSDGRFVQTSDASVFIRITGPENGHNILLIHGTGAWGAIWKDTEDVLVTKGFRVITMDMPPFGYSQKLFGSESYSTEKQANRILNALKAINVNSTYVLCHSVGCRATTEAVLNKPSLFKKFIQVDPALGFAADQSNVRFQQNNPSWIQRTLMSSGKIRDAIIATYGSSSWSIKPIFESFVFKKDAVTEERLSVLKRPLVLKDMTRAQGDWLQNLVINKDSAKYTDYENYADLTMPVLLIWGDKDELTPLWQGEALQKLYRNADLVIVPNAGHIPYLEDTARFNGVLLNFLTE